MSDNIVEITENTNYNITIDTSLVQNDNNVVIELIEANNIDVINNTTVLVGDLPQGYPLNWTVGNLPISRVSGLDIVGGNYISVINNSGIYTIISTGLQPSGNYSFVGHNHNSSDIIDFSSTVSGLLPVKNISAGEGIGVTDNSGIYTVAVTGTFGLTGEEVDDRVNELLISGDGINLNYDDNSNILTISTTGLQPSGNYSLIGHFHSSSDIIDFASSVSELLPVKNITAGSGIGLSSSSGNFLVSVTGTFGLTGEEVDDRVNGLLVAGDYINLNYNDNLNQLSISITGLQPSGNYANNIHYHNSDDIVNFNSSVSGLLPVQNLLAGTGIVINNTSGIYTISSDGHFQQLTLDYPGSVWPIAPSIRMDNSLGFNNWKISLYETEGNESFRIEGRPGSVTVGNWEANKIDIPYGGTNATTASGALANLGGAPLVHNHTTNNITNFNSSVSGLLSPYAQLFSPSFSGIPTAPTASSGTNNNQIANTSFVRTEISNLINSAPSALDTLNELAAALGNDSNFSTTVTNNLSQKANLSGANFSGNISAPTGDFTTLRQNGTIVSVSGHQHSSNDITNFNSGVSGLLPSIVGSGYVNSNFNNNSYIISVNGLQPSGNYSLQGHSHTTSNITDFNSAVSGLVSSGVNTSLAAGSGISLEYYSNTDTLTIATSGISFVGHKHNANEINDFDSAVKLIKLNDLAAPTGVINANSQRIINVATAVSGTDAINKNYIDTLLATTGTKGIASFDGGDFSVTSGVVSIKNSGIDNNQLVYSSMVLGSTTMNLGGTYLTLVGVTIDGGSP